MKNTFGISDHDRDILRDLAAQLAEFAEDPVNEKRAEGWRKINDLEAHRPMVWINEVPWHQMNYNDELTLQCEDERCRQIENKLRMDVYQWRHFPADMVLRKVFYSPIHIRGFDACLGLRPGVKVLGEGVKAQEYERLIQTMDDVELLEMPELELDQEATDLDYEKAQYLFGDLLDVHKRYTRFNGGFWVWDRITTQIGAGNLLMDLMDKPDIMHATIERYTEAYMSMLDQLIKLGALPKNSANFRVGSGGMSYTKELPFDEEPASSPMELWGHSAAQIFGSISPRMHKEFGLDYERKWMERFKLSYYGCCEPLDVKMGIMEDIPNLRKVSMSPFVQLDRAVEVVGDKYVYSHKPNPAVLAHDTWNVKLAQDELQQFLDRADGLHAEIILKDISTVRDEPQRLWEWSRLAMEMVQS